MIDEGELLGFASRFRDVRQLEREYLLTLLLHEISSQRSSNGMAFKGGTALRFFYNLSRFSEDLDFSVIHGGENWKPSAVGLMRGALDSFSKQYQIVKEERRLVKSELSKKEEGLDYEIRINGPLYKRNANQLQNVNIDISLRGDMFLEPELKYLTPIYYDIPAFSIYVMDIKEILSEKICAIAERAKMRDIYDAYYLMNYKKLDYDEDIVKEKARKRGREFNPAAIVERLNAANDKMKWNSELSYIVKDVPDQSEVVRFLIRKMGLGDGGGEGAEEAGL